jgi:hypothetical protein
MLVMTGHREPFIGPSDQLTLTAGSSALDIPVRSRDTTTSAEVKPSKLLLKLLVEI